MRLIPILLVGLLAGFVACSSDSPGSDDDDGGSSSSSGSGTGGSATGAGGGGGAEPPPCEERGFAAVAESWALPDVMQVNAANDSLMNLARDLSCDAGGYFRNATVDLTGDGRPDLVVTDDCSTGGLGVSQWDVYENTGEGFAASPIAWALPDVMQVNAANDSLMNLARDLSCDAGGYFRNATVDLTGDGRPDLVVTDDCSTGGLGVSQWDVYENTGDGFAASPIAWTLPDVMQVNAANDSLMNLARDLSCDAGGYFRNATVDLTGDGRPDLVVTDDCSTGGLGVSQWDVYENTGDGFAASPIAWTLPDVMQVNAANDSLMNLARDLSCDAGGYFRNATVDLTGDGRPDLVVTDDCSTGGLGVSQWDVYENTGAGFAASPIAWTLPDVMQVNAANDSLMNLARDLSCDAGGYFRNATVDLTGDGRPDLVVTDDCSTGGLGVSQWDVYENSGEGFAASATTWTLPDVMQVNAANDSLMNLARDLSCDAGGYFRNATVDLVDGGRLPDLVLTDDCATGGVGVTHWVVYRHACSP